MNAAVDAAQAAFPAWSALSPLQRGAPLKKLAELHLSEKDELARLDAISMGKPISTHGFDITYAVTQYNYFAEAAYPQGHTSLNTPGFLNMSLRQPFGVVAIIIPWNAPLIFFSKKAAPALAAGNCIIVKSSEKAPLTVCLYGKKLPSLTNHTPVLESVPMGREVRVSSWRYQRALRPRPNFRTSPG